MKEYEFTLVYSLDANILSDDDLVDRLCDAGCEDALMVISDNKLYIEISETGDSLQKIFFEYLKKIKKADVNLSLYNVSPSVYVNINEIAERLNTSKVSIHNYITGKRVKGDFPSPSYILKKESKLWRWTEVAEWSYKNNLISKDILDDACFFEEINIAIENYKNRDNTRIQEYQEALSGNAA